MQTSWNLLKTILFPEYEIKLGFAMDCLAQLPEMGQEIMLCMSMERVMSFRPKKITPNGLPPAIFRGLATFICKLASTCPKL